ncbi:MAG: PDZ domain-containing protein, partial [Rhodothermales bacterium]|nr:PDZ domain-containing protein [Rhodothermales bacterium]
YLGVGAQPVALPPDVAEQVGQRTALLVFTVEAGSPAEAGGLRVGDLLLRLDDQPLRHFDDLLAALGGGTVGREAALQIARGGRLETRTVSPVER